MQKDQLTAAEVVELLQVEIEQAGTLRAWAKANKLSAPYVSDVLHGRRVPAESICRALHLEREVIYTVRFKRRRKNVQT